MPTFNEMPLAEDDCRQLRQVVEIFDSGKASLNEVRDVLTLVRERLTPL